MYGKAWIRLGSVLADALAAYAHIIEPVNGVDLHSCWLRYEQTAVQDNAPRTRSDKQKYWQRLRPVFGHCLPDQVEPRDIRAYLDAVGGRQANLHISLLQHIYQRAIEWELATSNPCLGVRRNKERARRVYVSDQQYQAWLYHVTAMPPLKAYSILQYETGLRKSDILALRLDCIDGKWLRFAANKTGKAGLIGLTATIEQAISIAAEYRQRNDGTTAISQHIISTSDGRQLSTNSFDSAWKRWRSSFEGQGFAPNDLRAKHATDLSRAGGNATANLQHDSPGVTRRHYQAEDIITPLSTIKRY